MWRELVACVIHLMYCAGFPMPRSSRKRGVPVVPVRTGTVTASLYSMNQPQDKSSQQKRKESFIVYVQREIVLDVLVLVENLLISFHC
jgi:hypothetical protein